MLDPISRSLGAAIRRDIDSTLRGDAPPVARSDDALFAPDSIAWRIHADVGVMMVGGVSALMLQMLHPSALAGVWDHSRFREDPTGRLRRTARFMAVTTFAPRAEGIAIIDHVRAIHARVGGQLPNGIDYRADDPALLAWVHVTGALSFLAAWRRYAEPAMSMHDQDRYIAEMAVVAMRLGADPVPRTRAGAEAVIARFRPALLSDARTRDVAAVILAATPGARRAPLEQLVRQAGVDLLPTWARSLHGLDTPFPARPLVRLGALGIASTLRWARAQVETPRRAGRLSP